MGHGRAVAEATVSGDASDGRARGDGAPLHLHSHADGGADDARARTGPGPSRAPAADLGAGLWGALSVPDRAAGVRGLSGGAHPADGLRVPDHLEHGVRVLPRLSDT